LRRLGKAGLDDALAEHPTGLGARAPGEPAFADLVHALHDPHETEPQPERQEPVPAVLVGSEPAEYGFALIVIEELVFEVFPTLIHPGDAEEVVQVDEVLHRHGEESRELHAAGVGDRVFSAYRDHEAVVVRFELLRFRPVDGRGHVVRGHLRRLKGGLDDLG
jgi:hypothetical protein